MVQPLAEKKSIQVDLEVAPELGEVTLDQREFKQALYNLLSNAAKFSGEGARVKILPRPMTSTILRCPSRHRHRH